MPDNSTIYEANPDSSMGDRMELIRLIPIICDYLKTQGFDVVKASIEYEKHWREHVEEKEKKKWAKELEAKKMEATANSESYKLLFKNWRPYIDSERHEWRDNIKTTEYETVSFKEAVLEKTNVFVSHLALTDPNEYMIQLDKALEKTEFLIRRKDGAFYDSPAFRIKRNINV